MKFFLRALLFIVALVAGIGYLLPRHIRVERSITVSAPPAVVYAQFAGFRQFNKWSPWAELDPKTVYTFDGPETGAGAHMTWKSPMKNVGAGEQKIVEAKPYEYVKTDINFGEQGVAQSEARFAAADSGTQVTWSFTSDLGGNPIVHYFGLMIPGAVGRDYDRGLMRLKALVEALPKVDYSDVTIERVDTEARNIAFVATASTTDPGDIARAIGAAYGQIGLFLKAGGLNQAGAPLTITRKYDAAGYAFDAAIPVDRLPTSLVPAESPVQVRQTYAGPALRVVHTGSYRNLHATYEKLMAYAAVNGYETGGDPWEVYASDPGNTPEEQLKTEIYLPVK